ncbi:MAG: gamma carbonic anhydrase family protein [Bacteroidales bacterium]|nr:gamma carbonic anhydrase family protein [Bacteroidales bacterium]
MIKSLQGITPKIGEGSFVAETAAVIGDVEMGKGCSIWYGAVLRGDVKPIRLGNRVNVQDGACLHTSLECDVRIADNVTIGHNACVHSARIESHVLIGMGATVLDGVHIESGSVVAAGALVLGKTQIGPGELWGGVPAKFIKKLSPEAIGRIIEEGLRHYDYWRDEYLKEETPADTGNIPPDDLTNPNKTQI